MRRLQVQEGARLQSGEWQRRDVWVQSARVCMYADVHSHEPNEAYSEKKAEGLPSSLWRETQIWLTNLPPDCPFMRSISQISPSLPFLKINSADWRVCCRRLACFEVVSWEPRSHLCEQASAMREKPRWPAPACSAFFNQGGSRNWCHRVTNRMLWL